MNYLNIYEQLIFKYKGLDLKKKSGIYCETHHIKPMSLGGCTRKINLVNLTAKAHFVAHHLLTKIYPNEPKLIYAFWSMCTLKSDIQERIKVNSITYENVQKQISEQMSLHNPTKCGKENPFYGKHHTEETKQKISLARKGMQLGPQTKEHINKRKRSGKENGMYGRKHSNNTKVLMTNIRNSSIYKSKNYITWELVSPQNQRYQVYGRLKQFCQEHNLSFKGLYKIADYEIFHTFHLKRKDSVLAKNTDGWQIKKISSLKNLKT